MPQHEKHNQEMGSKGAINKCDLEMQLKNAIQKYDQQAQ